MHRYFEFSFCLQTATEDSDEEEEDEAAADDEQTEESSAGPSESVTENQSSPPEPSDSDTPDDSWIEVTYSNVLNCSELYQCEAPQLHYD